MSFLTSNEKNCEILLFALRDATEFSLAEIEAQCLDFSENAETEGLGTTELIDYIESWIIGKVPRDRYNLQRPPHSPSHTGLNK